LGCRLIDLFVIQALTADSDALFAEHVGDASLGDAVALADLLGSLSRLVAVHDIGDIVGGQEALRARFRGVPARQRWPRFEFLRIASTEKPQVRAAFQSCDG
jgi:hypothetical protein